ncbi:hypothetical protein BJX70DRAFT_78526 [Aspergillus crustosus]
MSNLEIEEWLAMIPPAEAQAIDESKQNLEIYIGFTKPESPFGYRWMMLLVSINGEHYTAYYSDAGADGQAESYRRKRLEFNCFANSKQIFTKEYWIGNIPAETVAIFGDVFFTLPPGPDQFFALRFLYELGKRELVDEQILLYFLPVAEYGTVDEKVCGGAG